VAQDGVGADRPPAPHRDPRYAERVPGPGHRRAVSVCSMVPRPSWRLLGASRHRRERHGTRVAAHRSHSASARRSATVNGAPAERRARAMRAPPGVAAGSARTPGRGRSLQLRRTGGPCVYTFHTGRVGRPGARRRPTLGRIPARGRHCRCPRTRGNGYRAGGTPDSHPVDNACSSRSFSGGVMRAPSSAGTVRVHGEPGRLTVEGSRRPGSSRPPG
jgi:hypothetical protein